MLGLMIKSSSIGLRMSNYTFSITVSDSLLQSSTKIINVILATPPNAKINNNK